VDQVTRARVLENPHTRPIAITIACILGVILAAVTLPLTFTAMARGIAPWYPAWLGVISLVGLACMLGLWMMQRWAVYVFTAATALNQAILFAKDAWNPLSVIVPAIIIVVMLIYISRMR
jgi:hypothetical protein